MTAQAELNPDHVINSLSNQIANLSIQVAKSDAAIIAMSEELSERDKRIKELEMENKQLHEGK